MLGAKILHLKIRWRIGWSEIRRYSIPYNEVKRIGIIIKNDNPKSNPSIETLIKGFKDDGKMIEVLCYQRNIINSKYNFPFFSFSHKDLKWNGTIKNDHFKKIEETAFDYLLLITDELDDLQRILMAKCPAKLRITNTNDSEEHFDMIISAKGDDNLAISAEAISKYIRQIR